jgi:glycosyltransferase involved in cell wall biosynthesis
VILNDIVEYDYVHQLPIDLVLIERKSKYDLSAFRRLYKLVKEKKPDIIHSWSSLASFFLIPTLVRQRTKFVNGIIADAPLHAGLGNKEFLRTQMSFPFSDLVIANSKAGIRSYKAPAKKSVCVYNGIDFRRFENLRDREQLAAEIFGQADEKPFVVGMVAAFQRRKDYETVVKSAVELCSRFPKLSFMLVGKGELMETMMAKVPAAMLNKQIIFTGARPDVESLIQLFDIGILMTNSTVHGEGVSNSIIEYMAGSKPVIASRGGGTDEVIDGKNGLLVDAFSKEQLEEKIVYLMNHPKEREEMGKYARTYAVEHFNLANMTKEYSRLYDDVLN